MHGFIFGCVADIWTLTRVQGVFAGSQAIRGHWLSFGSQVYLKLEKPVCHALCVRGICICGMAVLVAAWTGSKELIKRMWTIQQTVICRSIVLHNVHSCRRRKQFKAGSGVWVCNAIKWLLLLVWSASFYLVLLIWKRNQIRRGHHVFSHQKWWMTMFPLCFLFISSHRLLRAAVIRSSPALHTMSHCGQKQP